MNLKTCREEKDKLENRVDIASFDNRTTFIVGADKHAGKTTFLNFVLRQKAVSDIEYVYLSIGIDGEGNDVLTGMPKPKVYAEKDAYIITTESALRSSDALFEIKDFLNIKTPLGYLVMVKVIRSGNVELVGPETNSQLEQIINRVKNEFQITTILVDGAVDRLSQVTSAKDSQFYYVVSVSRQNLSRVIEKIKFINLLNSIDNFDEKSEQESKHYFVKGLLNKQTKDLIPEGTETIIVNDLSSIFLSYIELKNIVEKYRVFYSHNYSLKNFIVNLKDVEKSEFISELNNKGNFNNDLLIFNPYAVV